MQKMAHCLDALFNQSAGSTDRDFLSAVHNYHLEFHLKIAEIAHSQMLRETIERNHVLIFNWLSMSLRAVRRCRAVSTTS